MTATAARSPGVAAAGGRTAFLALGSNLGDRRAHLEAALAALERADGVRVAAVSHAFENPAVVNPAVVNSAVGGPPQGDYLNAVAELATSLDPPALHRLCVGLERRAGRVRTTPDAPRTLDLDLLAVGDEVVAEPELTLPHPRALARAFVLGPWAEIAPQARVPGTSLAVVAAAARLRAAKPGAFEALVRAGPLAWARPRAGRPLVLRDRAALLAWRAALPGTLGFVPTMGALHAGHASLARRARAASDHVLVSVFVNPLQFGPREDFARYPRTLEADLDLLADEGVDAVYAPSADDVYREGDATTVEVAGPAEGYEGARRPGHFRGVATVVTKLLLCVRPDATWFGRKDAQQVAVVARVHADLGLPGRVVVAPTVRAADDLALSSRNRYLGDEDRARAAALPRALGAARDLAARGEPQALLLVARAREVLAADGVEAEYVDVVEPVGFRAVTHVGDEPALLVAAARVGAVRLLDNEWLVCPGAR